jgi:hypothetical protein
VVATNSPLSLLIARPVDVDSARLGQQLVDPFKLVMVRCTRSISSICVCISVGGVRTAKAAIKLHTLLDLRGNIPTVVVVSSA